MVTRPLGEQPRQRVWPFVMALALLAIVILTTLVAWSPQRVVGTVQQPADEWPLGDIKAAQTYADWCGGTVDLSPGGPYVINCDR